MLKGKNKFFTTKSQRTQSFTKTTEWSTAQNTLTWCTLGDLGDLVVRTFSLILKIMLKGKNKFFTTKSQRTQSFTKTTEWSTAQNKITWCTLGDLGALVVRTLFVDWLRNPLTEFVTSSGCIGIPT